MGIKTKIEQCDSTVNPMMGCTGCKLRKDHCFAAALCTRHAGRKGWPESFDNPEFFPGRLEKAIRWRDLTGTKRPDKPWLDGYPRLVFVTDMGDGFCPNVDPGQWLSPLLDEMAASPHIFLLLTKWPVRMANFFFWSRHLIPDNFWFGTSITNQKDADERIPILLQIPAAVHYVSMEPLLSRVNIDLYLPNNVYERNAPLMSYRQPGPRLGWAIVGGETGHGARPMHPQWARALRDQCQAAGVPYFHKHNGEWAPIEAIDTYKHKWALTHNTAIHQFPDGQKVYRVGKKRAGHLLDGQEHNEMPRRER